jgi:hypothetical protein
MRTEKFPLFCSSYPMHLISSSIIAYLRHLWKGRQAGKEECSMGEAEVERLPDKLFSPQITPPKCAISPDLFLAWDSFLLCVFQLPLYSIEYPEYQNERSRRRFRVSSTIRVLAEAGCAPLRKYHRMHRSGATFPLCTSVSNSLIESSPKTRPRMIRTEKMLCSGY